MFLASVCCVYGRVFVKFSLERVAGQQAQDRI